jgi:hypothetical protein
MFPGEGEAAYEVIEIRAEGEPHRSAEAEAVVALARTVAKAFVVSARDSADAIRQVTECLRARGVSSRLVLDLNVPGHCIEAGCLPDDAPAGPGGYVCEMGELFVLRQEDAQVLAQVLKLCREIYTDLETDAS